MESKKAKNNLGQIEYKSDSFDELLSNLKNHNKKQGYCLILLTDSSKDKKQRAFDNIKSNLEYNVVQTDSNEQHSSIVEQQVIQVDANELLSTNETETQQRIDTLFDNFDVENSILYVDNGSNLCGAFTGYSLSKIKYATPQEKYFLKKITENNAYVVIDFDTIDGVDRTLKRYANALVTFPVPKSGIKKLIARLKQVRVNGFNLDSKRPVNDELKVTNF